MVLSIQGHGLGAEGHVPEKVADEAEPASVCSSELRPVVPLNDSYRTSVVMKTFPLSSANTKVSPSSAIKSLLTPGGRVT